MRKLAHETLGVQKLALVGEVFRDFNEGDRVMTRDGYPGRVTAVADGPYPQTEVYEVTLDGGAGGGQYSASQLSKMAETTAARTEEPLDYDLGPIEATTYHVAADDYPELTDVLQERPPNERVRVFAMVNSTAPEQLSGDDLEREEDPHAKGEQDRRDKIENAEEKAQPAVEPIDPPDACSFCGSDQFEDPTNTGRGTRMRCSQCGGTMTSWGGQWQPDPPNTPENAASGQGDFRSTINDLSAVHAALSPEDMIRNAETMYGTDRSRWSDAALRKATEHGDETSRGELEQRKGSYTPYDFATNVMARYDLLQTGHPQAAAVAVDPHSDPVGYLASVDADLGFHMCATWYDVRAKAKRIKDEGGVRIVAATLEGVTGEVQGEHHLYESSFTYVPGRRAIAVWDCGCKWGAYAWGRAPAYARFEGRQCSHVTALQYEAQSRGMFGATVQPDEERLPGQHQRSPVTVEYQRPTDRDEGGNRNRRTTPPGNMRTEWTPGSRVRVKGSLEEADLAPMHVFALQMVAAHDEPDAILRMLAGYGVAPELGLSLITWAVDKNKNGIEDSEEATADPMGGQSAPGTDIPRLGDRDQTDAKHKKKHILHHTNDARQHAPNFGWGIGHGIGPLIWCDQCNGSGCGHCGGTGQVVAPNNDPTGGMGPGDASLTSAPIADQSPDAGDAVSGDGLSSTGSVGPGRPHSCPCCQGHGEHSCGHECYACDASGSTAESHGELCDPQSHQDDIDGSWRDDVAPERRGDIGMAPTAALQVHEALLRYYADYTADSFMTGGPAQTYQQSTPHSESPNPGSTGWAASADPPDWEQPIIGNDFGAIDHYGAATKPPYDGMDADEMNADHAAVSSDGRTCDICGQQAHGQRHIGAKKEGEPGDPPTVSGVALKAADTKRVLMIQRSNKDEKDPARGTWEFPGGHHEEGDQTSLHAGIREWEEETGHPFPEGGHVSHTWRSGPYQGHVVVIPKEEAVDFSNGRATTNPDDPDGDDHEQSAWWEIEHAKKNPALRSELKDANPWSGIDKAAALSAPCETPGAQYSTSVSGDTAEISVKLPFNIPVGTAADADHLESHMHNAMEEILAPYFVNPPKEAAYLTMDEVRAAAREQEQRTGKTSEQLLHEQAARQDAYFATLHDEPEPALPSTDGADVDGDGISNDANDLPPGTILSAQPKTPWGYTPGDPNLMAAGPPDPQMSADDYEGDAAHDMLTDDTTNNLPFRSEASFDEIPIEHLVGAFQTTAGGRAIIADAKSPRGRDKSGVKDGDFSDSDIAAAALEVLAKTGSKDFSFSEQQELISEGGSTTRARNFGDLQIAETHYARLGDEIVDDDEFLFL